MLKLLYLSISKWRIYVFLKDEIGRKVWNRYRTVSHRNDLLCSVGYRPWVAEVITVENTDLCIRNLKVRIESTLKEHYRMIPYKILQRQAALLGSLHTTWFCKMPLQDASDTQSQLSLNQHSMLIIKKSFYNCSWGGGSSTELSRQIS